MPVTVYPQPDKVGKIRLGTYTTAVDMLSCASYSDRHRRILRSSYPGWLGVAQAQVACNNAQSAHRDGPRRRVTRPSATAARPKFTETHRRRRLHGAAKPTSSRISIELIRPGTHGGSPNPAAAATSSRPSQSAEGTVPFSNGFVHTVLRAWELDLHLTLRPDDVWLCVLTQLSFFVNGRAEALRDFFVAHEGKREVAVTVDENLEALDVPAIAQALVRMLRGHLVDEDMVEWLMPGFTTTSEHDKATAAVVVLGTVKQYFNYFAIQGCGFPSVTLDGERSDWEDLVRRVERLARFGDEAAEWARYLGKVLEGMVASFDRPEDERVKEFWMKACHSAGAAGSGDEVTLCGWLTSFCWWTAEGARQKVYKVGELDEMCHLTGSDPWTPLDLDGLVFPVIKRDEIPATVTKAPMTWCQTGTGTILRTLLLAGLTGMKLMDDTASRVQPSSGWWVLTGDPLTSSG